MKVFVTDGENRAALAVARSLGRLGHEVIVGEKHSRSLAAASRYCARAVRYPDPVSASEAFVDSVACIVRENGVDILIPVSDITTLLVTRYRDRFDSSCDIPFAEADIIERAADKVNIIQTAARLGVPVPRSVVVSDREQLPEIADLGFPLVVKPWKSRVRTAGGWVSTSVGFAANAAQLARDLSSRPLHEFPVMLQERIVGPGSGVFACYHEGRAVALFGHRRLRERPPWGGVSVLSESVPLCPIASEYATRLLNELGWHGVAMVEFKEDVRDGVPKLMEINGRFWGSLQLAVDAGVDFPALLVQTVRPGHFDPQPSYQIGVRNRWFWGDVDSLLVTLFGRNGWGPMLRSRRDAVLEFTRLWGARLYYDNPKWDDPWPWFIESYKWLRRTALDAITEARQGVSDGPAAPTPSREKAALKRALLL